jgi:hypothetical protein
MENQAKQEYDQRIDALRHNQYVTTEDIHDYEKAAII